MSSIAGTSSTSASAGAAAAEATNQLTSDDFMKILLTELANQDPLEPMDNSQLLDQMATIQSMQSSNDLTDSLQEMVSVQRMSQASSLIGKTVTGIDSNGEQVSGVVERVTVAGDSVSLVVDGRTVSLSSVSEILAA
jgi:flagellar basal-body rod modification protein FlgD